MATIWERPEGVGTKRWVATVRRRGHKPRSKSFSRKDLAEAWARKIETEIESGTYRDTRAAERLTFREACRWYAENVLPGLRDPTGREKLRLLRLENSSLAPLAVARIQESDVSAYLRSRAREIEASKHRRTGVEIDHGRIRSDTLRLEAARIGSIYKALRERLGLPVVSPITKGVRPLAGRGRVVKLDSEQIDKLLAASSASLRAAVEFQILTALRPGELAGMKWDTVDLAGRSLDLRRTKTDPRVVPLSERAVEILRSLKPRRHRGKRQPHVWPWTTTGGYSRAVGKAARSAGVPVRSHDLRHEAITRMIESGLTIPEVGAISGHKTWAMLRRYTEIRREHLIKRLDEVQSSGNSQKGENGQGESSKTNSSKN